MVKRFVAKRYYKYWGIYDNKKKAFQRTPRGPKLWKTKAEAEDIAHYFNAAN